VTIRLLIAPSDPAVTDALGAEITRLRPEISVSVASDCARACEALRSSTPGHDLVLLDLDHALGEAVELARFLSEHCPDTLVFTWSGNADADTLGQLRGLGAMDCLLKPLDAKQAIERFGEAIRQFVRGHMKNVSLPSFLQLLEMEQKTCRLAVLSGESRGALTLRRGALIHAATDRATGDAAAIEIVAWPNAAITIQGSNDDAPATIRESLGFIVLEAMRVQDEKQRTPAGDDEATAPNWPPEPRTWRGHAVPRTQPPLADVPGLYSGARLMALVDASTGAVLQYAASTGTGVHELARNACQILEQETATMRLCNAEGLEEIVLSSTDRCDVIRPLTATEFALLVFVPGETNLVMARLELEQFIAAVQSRRREATIELAHAVAP
jgi:DNA-binding response OmpR family regulator